MQHVTIRSMRYHTRYHTCYYIFSLIMQYVIITSMCYHIFPLSVAWFGAICSVLPRVTVKFIKKYILIFFKKNDGNAW